MSDMLLGGYGGSRSYLVSMTDTKFIFVFFFDSFPTIAVVEGDFRFE